MKRKDINLDINDALYLCRDMVYNILHSNGFYSRDFTPFTRACEKLGVDKNCPEFTTSILHSIMRYCDRNRGNESLCDYLIHHIGENYKHPSLSGYEFNQKLRKEARHIKLQMEHMG